MRTYTPPSPTLLDQARRQRTLHESAEPVIDSKLLLAARVGQPASQAERWRCAAAVVGEARDERGVARIRALCQGDGEGRVGVVPGGGGGVVGGGHEAEITRVLTSAVTACQIRPDSEKSCAGFMSRPAIT